MIHIVQNWRSMLGHLRDWRVYSLVIPPGWPSGMSASFHTRRAGGKWLAAVRAARQGVAKETPAARQAKAERPRRSDGRGSREFIAKLSAAHMDGLASAFDKDIAAVVTAMKGAGLQVADNHLTILEIASQNQKAPEEILAYFVPRTRPE